MSPFTVAYLLITVLLVFIEGVAIGRTKRGDTISEHVWMLRASRLSVWFVVPLFVWMTAHFVLPFEPDGQWWNDLVYVVVGLVVATWNYQYARAVKGGTR